MHLFYINKIILWSFVLWFASYAPSYLFTVTGLKPLYSHFAFLFYFAISLAIISKFSIKKNHKALEIPIWSTIFLFYIIIQFWLSEQSIAATKIFIMWSKSALFLIGFTILFLQNRVLYDIQMLFVIIVLFGTTVNLFDLISPTFTVVEGRAAGLYENPNISGKTLALAMVAGLPVIPRRFRVAFILLCGLGVFVTFSRSAWILWWSGISMLTLTNMLTNYRNKFVIITLGSIIVVGSLVTLITGSLVDVFGALNLNPYLTQNTAERLGMFSFEDQVLNISGKQRIFLASEALHQGSLRPVFGQGLAFTRDVTSWGSIFSTHNMYLLFWAEGGLVGLLLFIYFLRILWRQSVGVGRIMAIQIIISSVFTHNNFDQVVMQIFFAFIVAHGYLTRSESRNELKIKPKKSKY